MDLGSAAIGAGVGLVAGSTIGAIHYFKGIDKKNVEQGFTAGIGMSDKDLIASMGDYLKNAKIGLKGEGAGAKQRGRFDAFADGAPLLAAALTDAQETGAFPSSSTTEGTELANLINFFSSDGVFDDGKLWSNKAKAEPFINKIRSGPIWKKYFGSVADPFAMQPVTTPESTSLVMTGEEAYRCGVRADR